MKAVEVRAFGGPENLHWVDVEAPRPGPGEVLLRVAACGLNHADLLMREGDYLGGPKPPFRPGMEAAGVVEDTGPEHDDLEVGARVAVVAAYGLQASHLVVPVAACVRLPDDLPWEQAAALPVAYLTAYHALTTVARAEPGEVVLIHGAAGGVGTAAVGIARRLGLRVVATASTEDKRARVRELGAELAVSYEGFERAARELTGGRGPDVVLEMIGGDVMRRSLRLLPPFGRLVLIGMVSRHALAIDSVQLLFRSQAVLGFHLRALLGHDDLIVASLRRILDWIVAGELSVEVGEVLPLDQVRRAHELLASRRSHGKIVLVPPSCASPQ